MTDSEARTTTTETTQSSELPYVGEVGATRQEAVHVSVGNGQVRSVPVYRAVNVATHPDLAAPALSGALHRFAGGEELAIPFVYHDPSALKLALVVPEVLRHRALVERAELMGAIAREASTPVPAYVGDATVVIGLEELRAYLARPATQMSASEILQRAAEIGAREEALAAREASLLTREERLLARAESITTREDELRQHADELEGAQRELEARLQEMDARFITLEAREAEVREAPTATISKMPSVPPGTVAGAEVVAEAEGDSGDDEFEIVEAVAEVTGVGPAPEPVEASMESTEEEAFEHRMNENETVIKMAPTERPAKTRSSMPPTPPAEAMHKRAKEAAARTSSVEVEPEAAQSVAQATQSERVSAPPPVDTKVAPPPAFLSDPSAEMAVSMQEGVRVHVRVDEGREDAILAEKADLLAQYVVVQGYPVVLLTLVGGGERPYVRRTALDPNERAEMEVIEALRRSFAAQVSLYARDGRILREFEVKAPRELNMVMLLERLDRARSGAVEVDAATAHERALAAPPPVREAGNPFMGADTKLESGTARELVELLAKLEVWLAPEKLERLLLVLSVPRDMVDGVVGRAITKAVELGLPLTTQLAERAIANGVVGDLAELAGKQLDGFTRTAANASSGLDGGQIAAIWTRLLADASEQRLSLEPTVVEIATKAIRDAGGDPKVSLLPSDVDLDKLGERETSEIVAMLDLPKARRAAALELCKRAEPSTADAVYRSMRKMTRADVAKVAPKFVAFGEAAGDALIDGLSARPPFLRQAAALAIGHLKMRRGVVPLVHMLQSESTDAWRDAARALGEFGVGGLRAMQRALKEPKGKEDRLVFALAHLANHGCSGAIEQLVSDGEGRIAELAKRALADAPTVKNAEEALVGPGGSAPNDAFSQFSRRFHDEIAGRAPTSDLSEPEASVRDAALNGDRQGAASTL